MLVDRRKRSGAGNGSIIFLYVVLAVVVAAVMAVYQNKSASSSERAANDVSSSPSSSEVWASRMPRLNPEEAGCLLVFSDVYQNAANAAEAYFVASQDSKKFASIANLEQQEVADRARLDGFRYLTDLSNTNLIEINKMLPPSTMLAMHRSLAGVMKSCASGEIAPDLEANCLKYHQAFRTFVSEVDKRPDHVQAPGMSWHIYFQPRYSPFQIDLQTGEMTPQLGVSTPIGEFTASPKYEGIERLIIQFGDVERHLKLDRDFDILWPRGFEISRIKNDTTNKIMIISFYAK